MRRTQAGALFSFLLVAGLVAPPAAVGEPLGERWRHDIIIRSPSPEADAAREYFSAFQNLDVRALAPFYTEESVLRDPTSAPPVTAEGREAVLRYLRQRKAATRSQYLQVDALFARHDVVTISGVYRWRTGSDLYFGNFVLLLTLDETAGGYRVVEHEQLFDYERHKPAPFFPTLLVSLGYGGWSVVILWVIFRGFRHKCFGMPMGGAAALFTLSFITGFVGPWLDPVLFFPKESLFRVWMWRTWAIMCALLLLQCLLYDKRMRHRWITAAAHCVFWALTILTFISFYEDYYVNEITALVVLAMALAYFLEELAEPGAMRGMTPALAWGMAIVTVLSSYTPILYHPENAFPFPHHGLGFMFWVYHATTLALIGYAVLMTRGTRRRAAAVDGEDEYFIPPTVELRE